MTYIHKFVHEQRQSVRIAAAAKSHAHISKAARNLHMLKAIIVTAANGAITMAQSHKSMQRLSAKQIPTWATSRMLLDKE